MISKKITINLAKKDDIFHLEPLGDIHIGHAGFNEDLYKERVKAIANDDDRYTIFMGDQIDAITVYDKRFNPDTSVEHSIDNQRKTWQELTQPLIDAHKENPKIFGLMHGNHEYKIRDIDRAYMENQFCTPNKIQFLGAKCYLALEVRHKKRLLAQWEIMAMHGSGGGTPERLFQQMKTDNYMDVFMAGHLHQKRYIPGEVMQMDFKSGKVWRRPTHSINTGTFCEFLVEGTSGYGDQKNQISGTPIGTATLSFDAYQEKIVGHI
jgi:UDP-2,3-diacylglucosamine pyrophosphatase LpxH